MIMSIEEYIKKWDGFSGEKPINDPEFISLFIDFIKDKAGEYFEFEGDNGYCGHTALVYEVPIAHAFTRVMGFEFAYGLDFVKVFTAYHEGFWVPEYISLTGNEAKPILSILNKKIN